MDPKKERWAAGILVALGVIVWMWGLTARPVQAPRPPGSPSAAPLPVQSRPLQAAAAASRQSRYSDWGDNPFVADRRKAAVSTTASAGPRGLVLSGILWDPEVPSAIVNGRLVAVGDHLGTWQVIEIQKDQVILSDGATTQTLAVE